MEGRPAKFRGGSWRRGGGGGANESESSGGDHRGRGRGGQYRGRGKRDSQRGRGRRGGSHADFNQRDQDEGDNLQQEDDGPPEVFSRRKLESNWDRYEEPVREEAADDTPTLRGTDYHVLLESAGDSFTQFRFAEEKDWEMDSFTASQFSPVVVDLLSLAQSLEQLPLHQRLNLEAELVQVSTPVELPAMTVAPKPEAVKIAVFVPPPAAVKGLDAPQGVRAASSPASGPDAQITPSAAEQPADDVDEELDQLLGLQKPGHQRVSVTDERNADPEKRPEEVEEVLSEVTEKTKEVKDKEGTLSKATSARQEVTEEDLEDWLDSMIS